MDEIIIKEMELDNHQTVKLFDLSRKIGADAYLVAMAARMNVIMEKKLFTEDQMNGISFDEMVEKLGSNVQFEYKDERNFIMAQDKDSVLQNLVNTFMESMVQYLSMESFPGKLALKKYREL